MPGLTVAIAVAVVIFAWLGMSFGRVHTLEYALDWDHLTQTVSELTLSNGLHYLGAPWHSLIIYPGTMQNMVFSSDDSPSDELHTRTADGLQVVLEVTFQYQLSVGELHGLFEDYGQDFAPVYFDVASHLISEGATLYTAYEFFNSKEAIAASLQTKLNEYFTQHLHATVVSLQIQSCRLPDEFNQAITDTVTQRQNITNAAKFLDQQTVSLQTNLIVAHKAANSTVLTAEGEAQQILLQAEAASAIALQNGRAEAEAFANVKQSLGLTTGELLRYVWWDGVGATAGDGTNLLVGVSPAALVQTQQPAPP